MKASELLGSTVVDATGAAVGRVVDVRLAHRAQPRNGEAHIAVTALVVDRAAWPHRWGIASGRSNGPSLLRVLARAASRNGRRIPVADVAEWQPNAIRLRSNR
jgi:hypothetical protein